MGGEVMIIKAECGSAGCVSEEARAATGTKTAGHHDIASEYQTQSQPGTKLQQYIIRRTSIILENSLGFIRD